MVVRLYRLTGEGRELLCTACTNTDGRTDAPLLHGERLKVGIYELEFAAGDYFRAQGACLPTPAFIEMVPIRFGIADPEANYHVPLLMSPWSYATYRGS